MIYAYVAPKGTVLSFAQGHVTLDRVWWLSEQQALFLPPGVQEFVLAPKVEVDLEDAAVRLTPPTRTGIAIDSFLSQMLSNAITSSLTVQRKD